MSKKDFNVIASLTILLSCVYLDSFSQENFIPGYIIELEGDTAHGFIDFKNWRINPDHIFFKKNLVNDKTEFSPLQIRGFCVKGEIYESAIVETEISPANKNFLQYDAALYFRTDTVFLQAIFIGPKSLYFYLTSNKKEQFYIKEDTVFSLLVYKRYLVEDEREKKIFLFENKKYTGQLSLYLSDCKSIDQKTETVGYYRKSFEGLFLDYSKCTGKKFEYRRKKNEKRFEFGLFAGMTMTDLIFTGNTDPDPYFLSLDDGFSTNFTFGIIFDFIRVKNDRKWSWSNELIGTKYYYEGYTTEYGDADNVTKSHIVMSGDNLKWHTLLRYKFPVDKMFLFANAGISNGSGSPSENFVYQEINFYGMNRTKTFELMPDTRTYEFGLVGGIGARYKGLTFETRYEWGNGFSAEEDLTIRSHRIYFMLGYRF